MKKLYSLFLVFFVAISCSPSNIRIIKKEFKNYVNKTFDDPGAMKEIVEIIPSDTLSIEKVKNMVKKAYEICLMTIEAAHVQDSIETIYFSVDNLNLDTRKANSVDFETRWKVNNLVNTMMGLTTKDLVFKKDVLLYEQLLVDFADSLKYEAPIYEYAISYRVKQEEGLKLNTQYAYVDSLKGFINILPEKMTDDEYSEQYRQSLYLVKNAMSETSKLSAITKQRKENAEELNTIVSMYKR